MCVRVSTSILICAPCESDFGSAAALISSLLFVLLVGERRAASVLGVGGQLLQRAADERVEEALPPAQPDVGAVVDVHAAAALGRALGKGDRVDGANRVCGCGCETKDGEIDGTGRENRSEYIIMS